MIILSEPKRANENAVVTTIVAILWHLTVAERKQFKHFTTKYYVVNMEQKTSINEQFFIVTDWENTLSSIATTVKNKKENNDDGLDFVGVLPEELSLKIFSYLDVKSLCRSQGTCSKWYQFIEGCATIWRAQYKIYKSLVPSMPFKKRNSNSHWKSELQKVYQIEKFTQRWLAGEFSLAKSHDALPGNRIKKLPTEVWGTILEKELTRKQARTIRTY